MGPLGAWAFRAQKRHDDPSESIANGRQLLRKLMKVGVKNLENLKTRIDLYAGSCGKSARPVPNGGSIKSPLESNELIGFLEQLGLWDEANAERQKAQNRKKQGGRQPRRSKRPKLSTPAKVSKPPKKMTKTGIMKTLEPAALGSANDTASIASSLPSNTSSLPLAAQIKNPSCCAIAAVDDSESLSSLAALSRVPQTAVAQSLNKILASPVLPPAQLRLGDGTTAPRAEQVGPDIRSWARRHLIGALQALHLADTTEHAIEELNLSSFTADEEAIQELTRRFPRNRASTCRTSEQRH